MSFEERLKLTAADVDAVLDWLLPQGSRVAEAMRYAALGPGKRLRPFLLAESAGLSGVKREVALQAGAALECVHCYSLVHDDLPAMDDDDLRRGRPTLHKAFDEATAILAGDALLTFSFELLAGLPVAATTRITLVSALASASGEAGMVGGQMLDMEAESRVSSSLSETIRIQSLKTGALFRFACEAGALLGGADPAPLRQYADNIGLAFQIADDILDRESTPQALGKATQKDQHKGKATFVDLLGLDGAKARAADLVAEALTALEGYGAAADGLRDAARFIVERRR